MLMQRRGFRPKSTAKTNINPTFIPDDANGAQRCSLEGSANTQHPIWIPYRR